MIKLDSDERCPNCGGQEASDLLLPDEGAEDLADLLSKLGFICGSCKGEYVVGLSEQRYKEITSHLLDELARDEVLLKYGEGQYVTHPSQLN